MRKIDKQYRTENMKEVDFLTAKGIKYTFVYRDEANVRIYKYWKNKELFKLLYDFYNK